MSQGFFSGFDSQRFASGWLSSAGRDFSISLADIHSKLIVLLSCLGLGMAPVIASPIQIAIAGPMTGSSFAVGIQYQVGVEAALKTLTDGKILDREWVLSTHDDKCNKALAVNVAEHLIEEVQPDLVIGHSCSSATIAAAPFYAEHGILQITPASTNPQVTEMGIQTLFRMIGRDDVQGALAAQRLAEKYAGKRIGVMGYPGGYSRGLIEVAVEALLARNIEPVIRITGEPSAGSYLDQIQQFIDADVDVVYLVGGALDSGLFMRQVDLIEAPFDVISSDTAVSKVFRDAAGDAADGVAFTFTPEIAEMDSAAPAVSAIRALGADPAGYPLLAYAATEVWLEGVRRSGSVASKDVAQAVRQAPVKTILGQISFDKKGDIVTEYSPFSWFQWRSGARVPLE